MRQLFRFFRFPPFDVHAVFGWGTVDEAVRFCDYLNINLQGGDTYTFEEVTAEYEVTGIERNGTGADLRAFLAKVDNKSLGAW